MRFRKAVLSPIAAVIEVYTCDRINLIQGAVLAIKMSMPVIRSISFTVNDILP